MPTGELAIAILWHMHQPDYVDTHTGRSAMPWVRLHALLSYYDMVRVLREVPEARAVFNVVPVLLEQLVAASEGAVADDFLDLALAAPTDLSAADRDLLLNRFFAFNHGRRFKELPRLAELWQKRQRLAVGSQSEKADRFSDQELLDLQVGFHLAWSGRSLREHDLVAALFRKGQDFTPQEKSDLLQLQQDFLGQLLPAYREAAAAGSLEIACTPYSHPILPLLCDTRTALEAAPDLSLPAARMQRPGDAWYHVRTALTETERWLGVRPAGMWPAEGAISDQSVRVFASEGVSWIASDQDVLAASLAGAPAPPGHHFQPFRYGGEGSPAIFFRDKGLSDRIGFVYASWSAKRAAADMVGQLQTIRAELPAGRFLVPIILDGENPWENYAENGVSFLRELYRGVAAAEGLQWTTFAAYLADGGDESAVPLEHICAGSWIRNDFTTWIGNSEKNAGWDRLCEVRDWLEERLQHAGATHAITLPGEENEVTGPDPTVVGPGCDSPLARSWRAMVAAESSDWFWWYGDDHSTDFALEFDTLFRTHLANVYRHLGEEPDPLLQKSLLTAGVVPAPRAPRFPLQVVLDGRVSSYFEWLDAGWFEPGGGGAMHRTDAPVGRLYFGGDTEHLFLRLDPHPEAGLVALGGLTLELHAPDRVEAVAALQFPATVAGSGRLEMIPDMETGVTGVYDQIVEVAVPWRLFDLAPNDRCEFTVYIVRGREVELVLPTVGYFGLRIPMGPDDADDWLV